MPLSELMAMSIKPQGLIEKASEVEHCTKVHQSAPKPEAFSKSFSWALPGKTASFALHAAKCGRGVPSGLRALEPVGILRIFRWPCERVEPMKIGYASWPIFLFHLAAPLHPFRI